MADFLLSLCKILQMAKEIERKFLILNDDWKVAADQGSYLSQGYLNDAVSASVRVRVSGDKAYLNIKSATLGVSRSEYEYEIPRSDALEILQNLCTKPLIEKTRYHVHHGDHLWEVDVFHGDNEGLVVAEIELGHEDEHFDKPNWAGDEVSHDPRYYNVCMVKHPFKDW